MDSFNINYPFSQFLYKRKYQTLPRLYLRDEPTYRYSRLFLTRRGLSSMIIVAAVLGIAAFSLVNFFV